MKVRMDCLELAATCVSQDRNAAYGEPEDNFQNIADIWNAQGLRMYKDSKGAFADEHERITATDVALLMVGMKLARLRFNPGHQDSWVDMAGYAACGMETAMPKLEPTGGGIGCHPPVDECPPVTHKEGWLTPERCGTCAPHAAHQYSSGSRAFDNLHGKLWCDGYV